MEEQITEYEREIDKERWGKKGQRNKETGRKKGEKQAGEKEKRKKENNSKNIRKTKRYQ